MPYIYGIYHNNELIYIGKANCFFNRITNHLDFSYTLYLKYKRGIRYKHTDLRKTENHLYFFLNKLFYENKFFQFKVLDECDVKNLGKLEISYIKRFCPKFNTLGLLKQVKINDWTPRDIKNEKHFYELRESILINASENYLMFKKNK